MMARLYGHTWAKCIGKCIQHVDCKSINHWEDGNGELKSECELNSKEIGDEGVHLHPIHDGGRGVYGETPKRQRKVCLFMCCILF